VPVPGYTADQVEVTLRDGVVSVTGENERRSFDRSLIVPDDVDVESVDAKVQNGLLHLCLKRYPQAQPKKIHVK
jgi:HSP20 family protein